MNKQGTPRNLRPFRKGQSGNPRGRPTEPWRDWLGHHEADFRERLARIARDRRVTVATRARVLMYLLDQTHGSPKQSVDLGGGAALRIFLNQAEKQAAAKP